MRKFSRCVLIVLLVTILGGAAGYIYESYVTKPVYKSTTVLRVTPAEGNDESIRATDGGLNNDFEIMFKGESVISSAQRKLGTSEEIADYLSFETPANSNILKITCVNPDKNTAKNYVDAVAKAGAATYETFPAASIKILSEGTLATDSYKPDLYRNTVYIAAICFAVSILAELLIYLFISAFGKKDDMEAEAEYERRFGNLQSNENIETRTVIKRVDAEDVGFDIADALKEEEPKKRFSYDKKEDEDIEEDDVLGDDTGADWFDDDDDDSFEQAAVTLEESPKNNDVNIIGRIKK